MSSCAADLAAVAAFLATSTTDVLVASSVFVMVSRQSLPPTSPDFGDVLSGIAWNRFKLPVPGPRCSQQFLWPAFTSPPLPPDNPGAGGRLIQVSRGRRVIVCRSGLVKHATNVMPLVNQATCQSHLSSIRPPARQTTSKSSQDAGEAGP